MKLHITFYQSCNYFSMLRLKLNHVSKRGHKRAITTMPNARLPQLVALNPCLNGNNMVYCLTLYCWIAMDISRLLHCRCMTDRMCQDYVYVKWEYWSAMWNIKHYMRHENKVNENKVFSYCDALRRETIVEQQKTVILYVKLTNLLAFKLDFKK